VAIEIGYRDTNAWMEWIKYAVHTLNKSDCYVCTTGRPESQVAPFLLGWSSNPDGMNCILALFHYAKAWSNLPDAITTVPRCQRSYGSALEDY
jgi:hypothetical protein